jgi:hypothetical protein
MSKRILNVITCAYRATLEEQDDPVVWLTHSMRAAQAPIDVLLCGNAVCYGLQLQDASGLAFGERRQSHPPRIADDVAALLDGGASVFYAAADAGERGIDPAELLDGLTALEPGAVPDVFSRYDLILYW